MLKSSRLLLLLITSTMFVFTYTSKASSEMRKLKQELEKAKQISEETETQSTTGNNTTTGSQQASTANDSNQLPSIRVFLVEKKILPTTEDRNSLEQGTFQLKRGTFLNIISDRDITLTAGKFRSSQRPDGQQQQTQENYAEQPFQTLKLTIPVALQLTHAGNTYCAETTITELHLPQDNSEQRKDGSVRGKEENMIVTQGECP